MRIALIGHIPHDRYQFTDGTTHTGFGGVLYGAAALAGAMRPGDEVVLVSRVGDAIAPAILALVAAYGRITPHIDTVPGHGWVVNAAYLDGERRREQLVGGVPPWTAAELLEAVAGCDAVILNMVTGYEVELPEFRAFAAACPLLHLDFHSLALGRDPSGLRVPARNTAAREWCGRARLLQMNRSELRSVLPDAEPLDAVSTLLSWGPEWVAITDGSNGVHVAEAERAWHLAAVEPTIRPVDPTGCGDVFGACLVVGILRGLPAVEASRSAEQVARRNADQRGIPTPERLREMFQVAP